MPCLLQAYVLSVEPRHQKEADPEKVIEACDGEEDNSCRAQLRLLAALSFDIIRPFCKIFLSLPSRE
jgi:hypothetical protein